MIGLMSERYRSQTQLFSSLAIPLKRRQAASSALKQHQAAQAASNVSKRLQATKRQASGSARVAVETLGNGRGPSPQRLSATVNEPRTVGGPRHSWFCSVTTDGRRR